jgi:hypothetical protein
VIARNYLRQLIDGSVLIVNGKFRVTDNVDKQDMPPIWSSISFLTSADVFRMRLEISVSNHSFFCSLVERESKINQLLQAICFEAACFGVSVAGFSRSVDRRATGPTMNAVSVGEQTFSEAVPQTGS